MKRKEGFWDRASTAIVVAIIFGFSSSLVGLWAFGSAELGCGIALVGLIFYAFWTTRKTDFHVSYFGLLVASLLLFVGYGTLFLVLKIATLF